MKKVTAVILLFVTLILTGCTGNRASTGTQAPSETQASSESAEQPPAPVGTSAPEGIRDIKVDKGYLIALDTIDSFLESWRLRNPEQGISLLTDNARNSVSSDQLIMFFTGLSNPHHQGYEVTGADRINDNTVRFYVWIYEYYTGESPEPMGRPNPYYVDVVNAGGDKWLVNNFPAEIK